MPGLTGTAPTPADDGVQGKSVTGNGVDGISTSGVGVAGICQNGDGVRATSAEGNGLSARSTNSVAIFAESVNGFGVAGIGHKEPGVSVTSDSSDGVRATSADGNGLSARSTNSVAIFAESVNSTGVLGIGHKEPGVSGTSDSNDGVRAISASGNGLSAFGGGNNGVGIFAQASAKRIPAAGGNTTAGFFDGNVQVTGDIQLTGADCAENFDIAGAERAEPGTVMVLGDRGILEPSGIAYNKRVVGVISGAGNYKPGIVLDKQGSQPNRKPIALVGKVYCKVDAQYAAVETGDLLTTSPTPGHAMKASDQVKAFGAVIGKALRPLTAGQGLIPIVVALQ
jgi:hypothetical protein